MRYLKIILGSCILFILYGCNTYQINGANKTIEHSKLETINFSEKTEEVSLTSDKNPKELDDSDFEVHYNGMKITSESLPEDFENKFGYPEDYFVNNCGYISSGNGYRRWEFNYPKNYPDAEIRLLFLSSQKTLDENKPLYDDSTYLIGVFLNKIETSRGLKVGDDINKIFKLYGVPQIVEKSQYIDYISIIYSKGDFKIRIQVDNKTLKVEDIFINYRMEKSIEDQDITGFE